MVGFKCDIYVQTYMLPFCLKVVKYGKLAFGEDAISSHMHMWYFDKDEIDLSSAKEISFEFSRDFKGQEKFKVERCGIHMICLQDAVDFRTICSEFVHGESNVITNEPSPSRLEIIDLETNEPCPKRIKFSSFP